MGSTYNCKIHGPIPLSDTKSYPSKTCKSGFAIRCNQCSRDRSSKQRARVNAGIPASVRGVVDGKYICPTHGSIPVDDCYKYACVSTKDGFRYICPKCSTRWSSEKYARDPEASHERVKKYKQDNPTSAKQYRDEFFKDPAWLADWYEVLRKDRWQQKIFVLKHYGGVCVRCGEHRPEFLCLDHIEDNGNEFRKETGLRGSHFYKWLVKNNLPNCGVQVLCHNCNQKKYIQSFEYGITGERVRHWRHRHKMKLEVLVHYCNGSPPSCACCGETDIDTLSMDHINGGGNKHRKEIGRKGSMFGWLKDKGFPSGFRVLCHNCNFSLGHYGYSPHNPNFK